VSFFTIFAFVIFRLYGSEKDQLYKTAGDRFFFTHLQVAATGSTAYPYNGSFDDNFIQIQQCHGAQDGK